jgi:N-acetylglucosaminyldiphosphoundecaprenol N-acetyl-beta-D-mannosaminyltransferase
MMRRVDILGVPFDAVTPEEAVGKALSLMDSGGGTVVTPNPEVIWMCLNDEEAMLAVAGADLILADGIGIIKAANKLKTPLPCRVTGIDWFCAMLDACAEKGKRVFLLGGKPGVAEAAALKYPVVCGTHDGYFTDDAPVIQAILAEKPDFLAVCLGTPKQELWMRRNRKELDGILMAGLGGSLDVLAGTVKRAPKLFQKLGLEWVYRVFRQPSRIPRLFAIPKVMRAVSRGAGKNARNSPRR